MLGLEIFIGGNAEGLKKSLRDANYQIKGFVNQNKAILKDMENLAGPATIAMTGLTLGIGVAVKKFADFEATMNRVQAVSGASAKEMAQLKQRAIELGAATKFSNEQAAEGMEELVKAGFTAQQTLQAIPGVLQLAAAGGVSVAQAAELASGTVREFNLQASEAGKVADMMAQAANQSSTDIGDLQDSLKYAGNAAAAANQSLEETTAALAIMGNAMVKGEMAGTSLRSAFVRLQSPPKEAATELHKLGISVADTHGKMLPLSDIMEQIRSKTAKLTDVQRNAAVAAIFGTDALSGMLALVRATPAQYQAMLTKMNEVDGVSKKMSDTINSGFKGSMDQLGASAEAAATSLGEQLAPAILAVASGAKSAVDGFNGLPDALKTVSAGALASSTSLLAMVSAAGLLLPVLRNVRTALFVAGAGLNPIGLTMAALAVSVGIATAAFKAHEDAVNAARAAEEQANQQRLDAAVTAKKERDNLAALVAEHDKLVDKTNRSKQEQERLKAVQDQLVKDFPNLKTAIEQSGNAHLANVDPIMREARALEHLMEVQKQQAQQAATSAQAALDQETAKLNDIRRQRAQLLSNYSDDAGAGGLRGTANAAHAASLAAAEKAQQDAVNAAAQRAMDSVKALGRLQATIAPPSTGAHPDRGGVVGGGGIDKTAEKEAKKAHEEAVKALDALEKKYSRLTQVSQAWGEGMAGEVKYLNGLITDIKKKGLDKTAEGAEAIVDAQTRLLAIKGQQAVQAKQKADEEANQIIDGVGHAIVEIFQLPDVLNEKVAAAKEEWKASFKDMAGAATALAMDPSMERIANFAQDLISNTEKTKEWTKALEGTLKAVDKSGGGLGGILQVVNAGFGESVAAMAPLVGIAAAIAGSAMILGQWGARAFDWLTNPGPIKATSQALQDVAAAMDALQAKASMGLISTGDVSGEQRNIASSALGSLLDKQAQLKAKLADLKQQQDQFDQSLGSHFLFGKNAEIDKQLYTQTTEAKAQLEETEKDISSIKDKYGDLIGEVAKTADAAKVAAERQERIAEAVQKVAEYQGQVNDLTEELTQGGRDAWGKRITLEAEKQLKLSEQQKANDKQMNDLLQRKADLQEQLKQLALDEAKQIRDIQNEGIAQRAKSEAQDKTERIAKVVKDADDKRKDLTQQISDNEAAIANAQLAASQVMSTINAQYDERIMKIQTELTQAKQLLDTWQQIQAVQSNPALHQAPVYAGTSTAPTVTSADATVHYGKYNMNYLAGGGEVVGGVEGKDTVNAKLSKGEVVVDSPTMRMVRSLLRGGGGASAPAASYRTVRNTQNITIGDVHVNIPPGSSVTPETVGPLVRQALNVELRRARLV